MLAFTRLAHQAHDVEIKRDRVSLVMDKLEFIGARCLANQSIIELLSYPSCPSVRVHVHVYTTRKTI